MTARPLDESRQRPGSMAKSLDPFQRQELALQAITRQQSICSLAGQNQVSRKFVYAQATKAQQALDEAFQPSPSDHQVLFYLPVTKAWLQQLTLALILICHSSLRGVVELLRDLFQTQISLGGVHNIVAAATEQARRYNQQQDLANVRVAAVDEIFQRQQPVFAGVDVDSTYCYLLSLEDKRDGDTWAIHLLDLCDRGFAPQALVADAGRGICKGHKLALPEVPRRGDVFHGLKMMTELVVYLENRAYAAISAYEKLLKQQARYEHRQGQRDRKLAQKIRQADAAQQQAIVLVDDVTTLSDWMQHDILTVAGPCFSDRCLLYDDVILELQTRQPLHPKQIGQLAKALSKQRDDLLAFAVELDRDLEAVAEEFEVSPRIARQVLQMQALPEQQTKRWQQHARLQQQLGWRFYPLHEAIAQIAQRTVRCSSVIENFNSRLRNYFFLRRHLGPGYLQLLQFFLNHRRFLRSEHATRVNRSPAELLTGCEHPHWLEMLGYQRFIRK